jgi:hypothetical protein
MSEFCKSCEMTAGDLVTTVRQNYVTMLCIETGYSHSHDCEDLYLFVPPGSMVEVY